ncbi:DUF4149 domain-containing protein [Noviherbaspirillum aridicola]|uniref:TMEM205-like domain-containing protein n=1 Tax=Noviherbaspirillum aridicola TaxID=2849687 RepID=A0ABQ4Q5C0_9BURK|nr:DUF4149 domain-containing protein [Noviherbaspirillum aridicola]GIZ52383.1 hypothetical protein NCCP691_23970 [Noviherbaspirillum aridicola]
MLAARVVLLLAVVWVGSMWTIGYLVAPTLFATLAESTLAGSIAGRLFRIEAWLALVCGLLMLGLLRMPGAVPEEGRRWIRYIVLGMLACTVLGYFALNPFMAELREAAAAAGGTWEPDARARFGMLHGVSSLFYLVQSLLGVALIWRLR